MFLLVIVNCGWSRLRMWIVGLSHQVCKIMIVGQLQLVVKGPDGGSFECALRLEL